MVLTEGQVPLEKSEIDYIGRKISDRQEADNFKACKGWFDELFPSIIDNYQITKAQTNEYKENVKKIESELKPYRHLFNHKYEKVITANYKAHGMVTLNRIEELFLSYCNNINLISLIFDQTGNSFEPSVNYEGTIKSVIDLIIFGSNMAMFSFFNIHVTDFTSRPDNNLEQPKFYRQLRDNFFNSEEFKNQFLKDID
jgi:hypothetical protein